MNIPRECYKYASGEEQINNEMQSHEKGNVEIVGYNFDGQHELVIKDSPYNYKTIIPQATLFRANAFKAVLLSSLKFISIFSWIFRRDSLLNDFIRIGHKIIGEDVLKDQHRSNLFQELHWCIFTFLVESGIDEPRADQVADFIGHLVECDNAYRFRIQDMFHATSKERLTHPTREIRRLFKLLEGRDNKAVSYKFKMIKNILVVLLLIPKYRKAFKKVVDGVTLENLKFDKGDLYWVHVREDYKFFGLMKHERMELAKGMGFKYPKCLY